MIEPQSCPVCDDRRLRTIGETRYRRSGSAAASTYVQQRLRVLFEVWCRDAADEVTITSKLCEGCGFVLYSPRPNDEDVDAKYRFLGSLLPEPVATGQDPEVRRAKLLYRQVGKYLPGIREGRVLDFGGGDGRLMAQFLRKGCRCYLIDYRQDPIPGVQRLGATLADIPGDLTFDLIVCSHVIEHLASPLNVIRLLREHLAPAGALYVEVPMEVWGGPPAQDEPVTHINFFTPWSLRTLLERAGLRVSASRLGSSPHPGMPRQLVIRAIGRLGSPRRRPSTSTNRVGLLETERFLNPTRGSRLRRRLLMPSTIPAAIAYRLRSLIRRR